MSDLGASTFALRVAMYTAMFLEGAEARKKRLAEDAARNREIYES